MVGVLGVVGCTDSSQRAQPPLDGPVAAAESLCPVMWTWVKDVGATFNDTARAVGEIDDVGDRRRRWMEGFDAIEDLNDQLIVDVGRYRDDPILAPLVAEIERDMPRSTAELEAMRDLFVEQPEVDDERHQVRTSQIIVRIEKVVDLPKPELAGLDTDGTLIPAFRSVPSCQHSMKDVDDGTIQSND